MGSLDDEETQELENVRTRSIDMSTFVDFDLCSFIESCATTQL